MALTRKLLKSLGLTEDQIEGIIEEHAATVEGLKQQLETYKTDAEKLPTVQQELDSLKAAGDGGYKEKYEAEQKAFADYKNGIEAEKVTGKKTAALDAALQKVGIKRESFRKQILKAYDLNSLEMDGDAIKEPEKLEAALKSDYADFVTVEGNRGTPPINPPTGGGTGSEIERLGSLSMADYINERKKK